MSCEDEASAQALPPKSMWVYIRRLDEMPRALPLRTLIVVTQRRTFFLWYARGRWLPRTRCPLCLDQLFIRVFVHMALLTSIHVIRSPVVRPSTSWLFPSSRQGRK
ncbi:hypothetical protein LZ32DRAFT_339370 [Colletotrichum eremochloae]|nr:hypothetical protein LZ32DRAFT_339370 [Colletotrichum eremochloae]